MGVTVESQDSFLEGLVFRLANFPTTIIPDANRKELSHQEYEAKCSERNLSFNASTFTSVLENYPISASLTNSLQAPLDPRFSDLGVSETTKSEFAIVTGGTITAPSFESYLAEYQDGKVSILKGAQPAVSTSGQVSMAPPTIELLGRSDTFGLGMCDVLKLYGSRRRLAPETPAVPRKASFDWGSGSVDTGKFPPSQPPAGNGVTLIPNVGGSGIGEVKKS